MTSYEMMVILSPDLGEQKTSEQLSQIRDTIKSSGGEILNEDLHGIRQFAYRIKKFDEGYYVIFNFNMEGEKVKHFESEFNINQAVLRYLISKTPKHYSFKTLAEYDDEVEKAAKEKEAEKAARRQKQNRPAPKKAAVKPAEKAEKPVKSEKIKEEKKAIPVEEPAKEKEPAESKEKLEKVDEKLKSIIDDPDIKL